MSAGFQPHYAAAPATQYQAQQYNQAPQHQQFYQQQCYQPQAHLQQQQCYQAPVMPPQPSYQPQPQVQYQPVAPIQNACDPCPVVVPRLKKAASTPYTHSPYAQPITSPVEQQQQQQQQFYRNHSASIVQAAYPQESHSAQQSHPIQVPSVESHESSWNSNQGSIAGPLMEERHNSLYSDDSSSEGEKQYRHRSPAPVSFGSDLDDQTSQDQQMAVGERQAAAGGIIKVTVENIHMSTGKIQSIAGSPHGSSFLQAALRQYPIEAFEVIRKELAPSMGKLLLDKHACYVVKMLLEMMDKEEAIAHLDIQVAAHEELLLNLCTKDLHSRRMVQFILNFAGATRCRYLMNLVMRRPMDLVRTQQGCITLQRILDHFPGQEREAYFASVRSSFMEYALDPFGNYIVQYMLTEGNQVVNSHTLALFCRGQLHHMICHKYASNVIEKCFGLVTPELQHEIIEEIFNAPEPALVRVLSDSNANYVVQAAIRSASCRDVQLINHRIGALLPRIQFGKKLQQRLARRLKQ